MLKDLMLETYDFVYKIQNCTSQWDIFEKIIEYFKACSGAEAFIVDKNGKILNKNNAFNIKIFDIKKHNEDLFIDSLLNEKIKTIRETKENFALSCFFDKLEGYNGFIVPLKMSNERMATLFAYKNNAFFDKDEIIVGLNISAFASAILSNLRNGEVADELRKKNIVKSALSILSYSELEATINIFEELDGTEGILVASKVADKAKITRSVIVNSLRKLESAGVLESRSLGMKGTHIRVLNEYLILELNKLKR